MAHRNFDSRRIMDLGDRSILLIGYRGTGKTTVAQLLAGRLGWDWMDADDEIERRAGKSIAAIFAEDGEAEFRDLEASIVAELCRWRRSVVALGGGAVLSEANRTAIRLAGIVVWLTATVDTLVRRLAADEATASRRPPLTESGGLAEIETLLATREPIYRACATFEVDTEDKTPAEIVEEIVARLQSRE
ncbi:MAG: shikimate kinase [Pirellulales bacterium]